MNINKINELNKAVGKVVTSSESSLAKLDPNGLRQKPQPADKFEGLSTAKKTESNDVVDFLKSMFGKLQNKNKIPVPQEPFATEELARGYAQKKVLKALHSDNSHEYMVVINKNTNNILGEYKGDKDSVSAGLDALDFPDNVVVIHGHPTYYTENGVKYSTPISFSDFKGLNRNQSECTAINPDGEYSTLIKKADFKELSPEMIKYYEGLHMDMVYGDLFEKNKHKLHPLLADCERISQLFNKVKQLKEQGMTKEQVIELKESMLSLFPKNYEDALDLNMLKNIHKFWQKYADEMGLIYKTNYSYLGKN